MKIAFWNVNTGATSYMDRKSVLKTWLEEVQPDLLMLEEISSTLVMNDNGKPLVDLTGYSLLKAVNTLDKNLQPSTKCLAALVHPQTPVQMSATPLRFPDLDQRRMLLKVITTNLPQNVNIWAIHANASEKGGAAAREAVEKLLATETGKTTIVGGDFNAKASAVATRGVTLVAPLRIDGVPMKCTQWTAGGAGPPSTGENSKSEQMTAFGFTKSYVVKTIKPNSVIDYVMHGASLSVKSEPNCVREETWRTIVAQFDHAPVVYSF